MPLYASIVRLRLRGNYNEIRAEAELVVGFDHGVDDHGLRLATSDLISRLPVVALRHEQADIGSGRRVDQAVAKGHETRTTEPPSWKRGYRINETVRTAWSVRP